MNTFLFFDDFILDHYRGIRRRHFKPVKCGSFYQEGINAGSSVIYSPEEKQFLLYYNTMSDLSRDWDRNLFYAESTDGINFEPKGTIKGVEKTGSLFVMRDDHTLSDEERFKTIIMKVNPENPSTGEGYVAVSPDGINWTSDTPYKVSEHSSDTTNNIFYNAVLKKYQVICRGAHVDRRITSLLSEDLKSWSDPLLIMAPTPFDVPLTQYYGMTVAPLDGVFLGFLQLYYTDEDDPVHHKMAGKVDTALTYSYNGLSWNRVCNQPMVDRPMPPDFGCATIYFSSINPDASGGNWILTGGGTRTDHACGYSPAYPEWRRPEYALKHGNSGLLFYRIRKHGFTGMEAYGYRARMRFRRMKLVGQRLTFNLCAPTGYVKFQLLDDNLKSIPGFTFDESIRFSGDETEYTPRWKNRSLNELSGRPIFIELEMQTAILFALEGDLLPNHGVQPEPCLGTPWPV